MVRILFVCLGNICRSPALEATLRKMVLEHGLEEEIEVDSCGLGPWFLTSRADPSMVEAAKKRGIAIDTRAKLFSKDFFNTFDYIFAVDNRIIDMLKSWASSKKLIEKIQLATAFAHRYLGREIPDPYLGDERGFETTMDIVEDACRGILEFLIKQAK